MWSRVRIFRRLAARQERDPIVLGGSRRAELRDHQRELHNFQMRLAFCAGAVLLVFFLLVAIKHRPKPTTPGNLPPA